MLKLIMQSKSTTVAGYLDELPEDRRQAINKVRAAIRKNLPKGYEETMQYGMITYVVPHKLYPAGYHCNPKDPLPFVSLASQKNYMSLYLMACYMNPELKAWVIAEAKARGNKLDMGKSCIRFKKLEELPLDVVGEAIAKLAVADYIALYEGIRSRSKSAKK